MGAFCASQVPKSSIELWDTHTRVALPAITEMYRDDLPTEDEVEDEKKLSGKGKSLTGKHWMVLWEQHFLVHQPPVKAVEHRGAESPSSPFSERRPRGGAERRHFCVTRSLNSSSETRRKEGLDWDPKGN